MKTIRLISEVVACICLLLSCNGNIYVKTVNPPDFSGKKDPKTQSISAPNIFNAKDGAHTTYRIPALAMSTKGTLLAFCEGRKNSSSDTGDINLCLRRSTDGGQEWSSIITVWDDGSNTCGNPVPIVDPETGRIHLLMTWNYETDGTSTSDFDNGKSVDTRRVYYTYSDDDGLNWATPVDITAQAKTSGMGWYATGPCHGMIVQNGEHKGRFIVPCDCHEDGKGYSHVLYSDDKGKNWALSNRISGNECCVAEVGTTGRLIMSIRNGSKFRGLSYSEDSGATWSAPENNQDLPDPGCQGSIINTVLNEKPALIQCNASSSTSRINLTLKASFDEGVTWSYGYCVYNGSSGYSDIMMLSDGKVGVFYENNGYARISFVTVNPNLTL